MAEVAVYNMQGEKTGQLALNDAVFNIEVSPELVQFVSRLQRANAHVPYAHTKGRAQIRGGGRKPWKQKGTGNARHGSIRSPLWRGGGVTFGPTSIRNMEKKVNKKEKNKAVKMMLSDKVASDAFIVVDSFEGLKGKTKELATALTKLPAKESSVLIAYSTKNEEVKRGARNLPKVNTILIDSINVGDLLKYQFVLVDKAGVEVLEKRFQ